MDSLKFFVTDLPTVELKDGHVHVGYAIGDFRAEFVYPPHLYLRTLRNCNRVSDEFHGSCHVVPFAGNRPKPAH